MKVHAVVGGDIIRRVGFPYPVEKVNGTFVILPDHWKFRDFTGSRNGAGLRVRGSSFPRSSPWPQIA